MPGRCVRNRLKVVKKMDKDVVIAMWRHMEPMMRSHCTCRCGAASHSDIKPVHAAETLVAPILPFMLTLLNQPFSQTVLAIPAHVV